MAVGPISHISVVGHQILIDGKFGRHRSDHENVYASVPPLRWGVRLALCQNPCLVGVITLFFMVLFIGTGIYGIFGEYSIQLEVASTTIGVCVSVIQTVLVTVCIKASIRLKITEHHLKSSRPMQDLLYADDLYSPDIESSVKNVQSHFDVLSHKRGALLCVGLLFLNWSISLVFWGLAVSRMEFIPPVWYPFIFVDLLMGVASPICFIISIYMIAIFTRNITKGRARPELIVPAFLTFAEYIHERKDASYTHPPYWKIVDYFTFPILPRKNWGNKKGLPLFYTFPFNWASWCLNGIVTVTFCLSVTYIVGQLMTTEEYVLACDKVKGDNMNCFDHRTNEYINCSADDSITGELDCYRFNQIGVENDPIGTIITALFLYLACEKFLTVMFKFLKELFKLHPSRLWGVGVTGIGVIFLLVCIACSVVYDLVHSVYFDFLKLLQLFIISTDIFLSGVILISVQHVKKKTYQV